MRYSKPRKFAPNNPKKWVNPDNIISRSGLETRFFHKCDTNPNIIKVASEEVVVPYISAWDSKTHRYYIDLYIKIKTKDGTIKEFLVEIKPLKFTKPPRVPKSKRKTKGYLQEVKNYIVNQSKWEYATEFAKNKGMEFIILTEKDL